MTTVPQTQPSVQITSEKPSKLNSADTPVITFTFSEEPVGFTFDDIVVGGGTLSGLTATANPLVYQAVFTPTLGVASGMGKVEVQAGSYTDLAGNAGIGGDPLTMSYETVSPGVSIHSDVAVLKAGDVATITFRFSTAPTGFTSGDTIASNGFLSNFSATANPLVYTATFTPTSGLAQGHAGVTINDGQFTDHMNNPGVGGSLPAVRIDTLAPTTTAVSVVFSNDSGTSSSDLVTSAGSQTISGTLSAPLVSGEYVEVSLNNGLSWVIATVSATNWALNGFLMSSNTLQVRVVDAAGNYGQVFSADYVLDQSPPTLVITSNTGQLKAGETATITFTFSEEPVGFAALDITVTGGTLSGLTATADPLVYQAVFTPTPGVASGTATVAVQASSYTDLAGNFGSSADLPPMFYGTQVPAQIFSGLQFSDDSGSNGSDFITNTSVQTLTATLSAPLDAGDRVFGSLDNGSTWLDITSKVQGTTLTWDDVSLSGSDTLRLKVTNAEGNDGEPLSQLYTLDTTAPVFTPAAGTPVDNATGVSTSSALVLHFGERLGSFDVAKIHLYDTAANTTVAITASINASGHLVITPIAILKAGTAYHLTWDADAILDVAGNAALALSDASTFNFTTVTGNTSPTTPTEPEPTKTVDGAQVSISTAADGSTITTIAPVAAGRTDDPNSSNTALADVPLLLGSDGRTVLQVGLPVGVGLQAQGHTNAASDDAALAELILRIKNASNDTGLLDGGQSFASDLNTPLFVQTLTLSTGAGFDPRVPLVITGSTLAGGGQQAIVVDAKALPSGSIIQIDNVDFAAIIGAVRVIGGAGQNTAIGDGSAQWMVLGEDDDILHGGGGNDIVGSLGGNDQVFGGDGDDVVFGGTGNDILSGGAGNDKLDGGLGWDTALQSGSLADYSVHQEGNALVFTHKTTGEVDHLKSVEMVKFDTGSSLYIADSDAEAAIAHIATKLLGRDLTADEGAQFQALSHLSALEVAQAVLRGPLASEFQNHTAQELIDGWQTNPQILRMDVVSELVQGSAGVDAISYGLQLTDGHLQWVSAGVWEGTNLTNGDMAQLHSIERVYFTDASVALDGANVAALIAVTLGGASLQDRAITSEGLSLMDSGWSNQDIGAAALQLAMGAGTHTEQDIVQWLWTKAHGSAGSNEQLQPYVQQLQSGAMTTGDLAWEAAQYAQANPQVALAGVLQQGLVYDTVIG